MVFKNYIKLFGLLFIFAVATFSAPNSNAEMATKTYIVNQIGKVGADNVTPTPLTNLVAADLSKDECTLDNGFINQIVTCIKTVIDSTVTETVIAKYFTLFKSVGASAVVLYIMFFGLKIMFGGVQKVRSEAMVVFFTAAFIVFFNQAAQITSYTKAFYSIQDEFVNAATSALSTRELLKLDRGIAAACATATDKDACFTTQVDTKLATEKADLNAAAVAGCSSLAADKVAKCKERFLSASDAVSACRSVVAPAALKTCKAEYNDFYASCPIIAKGVWRKIDCLIPRIMGAHPFAEKVNNCIRNLMTRTDLATGVELDKLKPALGNYAALLSKECGSNLNIANGDTDYTSASKAYKDGKKVTVAGVMQSTIFSLFVILAGTFFNSDFGLMILLSGVFIPILIIMAFVQAVYVYITSFIALTILGLFAPLILPCFLFRHTRQIFDAWLKVIIAMTLKPGVILVYLTFMIYILNAVVSYGGMGNSKYRSYLDFIGGKAFDKSTLTQATWGRITKKFSNQDYCYKNMKEQIDVKEVADKAMSSSKTADILGDWKCSQASTTTYTYGGGTPVTAVGSMQTIKSKPVVIKSNINNDICKSEAQQARFAKYIESVVDQYYGNVNTNCQASQDFKVPVFNFGNVNNIEMGVYGIVNQMINLSFIPTATVTNLTSSPQFSLAAGSSADDVKKLILNNAKIFPICDQAIFSAVAGSNVAGLNCDSTYGGEFVKRFQEYLKTKNNSEFEFLISMLVVLVVLAITITFMNNVLEFGDSIAGIAASGAMKISNLYGAVSAKFNKAIFKG